MKRTAAFVAISAVTGINAPMVMAELNSNSTLQDVISFTNGLDQRTTDAYTKAEEGATIRAEHDRRMNVQSDRIYKSQLTASSAPHYDGDKVVTTDRDLTDTITGAVMLDEQGNALKVRELRKGSDDITLRGDNGTGLHNVAAGTEDRDAVNVSQLKASAQGLQNSIDGQSEAITTIDAAQQQESKDRIAGYEQNSARITTVVEQKADKADVNEVRGALSQSTSERIAADADHDSKIADLYDTKANAVEVNEWIEKKADKEALAREALEREQATAQDREALSQHDSRISAAQESAANSQAGADKANAEVARLDSVKADRSDVEIVAGIANAASVEASGAKASADKANTEAEHLEAKKADRSEVKEVESSANRANDRIDSVQTLQKVQGAAISNAQSTADAGLMVGNAAYKQSLTSAEDIQHLGHEVNAVDTRSVQRAQKAEQNANAYTDGKVVGLKQEIKKVDRDAKSGVAAAIALGQLQAPIHAGKGSVSVGVGNWKGANAVSVGGGYRWGNDQWSAKGGASFSDHGNALGGSVSYEF